MRLLLATISAVLLVSQTAVSPAQDARAFVRFPEPMQEHMLGNMRDHLVTLNEILATLPTANTRLRSLLNKSWE